MDNETRRDALSSAYNRAIMRGDRAGAKRIWRDLFALTCEALKK